MTDNSEKGQDPLTISDKPTDFLADELRSMDEMSLTIPERARLTAELAFRILVEGHEKANAGYQPEPFVFIPGIHGNLYLLPNKPEVGITKLDETYHKKKHLEFNFYQDPVLDVSGVKTLDGFHFARVPQQCVLECPVGSAGVYLATLTECALLVGKSENSLFVAHVGYGQAGNIENVLRLFEENGISNEDVLVIVSKSPNAKKTAPWYTPVTEAGLLKLGFKKEKVVQRECKFVPSEGYSGVYGWDDVLQVTVSPDFVAVNTFDYRQQRHGITKLNFHDDVKCMEI